MNKPLTGALSALFAKAAAPAINNIADTDAFAGALSSAVVGGTGAVLGGGEFANGAMSDAFAYLFNNVGHNTASGKTGEAVRLAQLAAQRIREVLTQVMLEALLADGTKVTAVADFVYEHNGKIIFEEVKTALFTTLSTNQIIVYDVIHSGAVRFANSAIGAKFSLAAGETLSDLGGGPSVFWLITAPAQPDSGASMF